MRLPKIMLVIVIGTAICVLAVAVWKMTGPRFVLRSCFHNIQELKRGASVRVAGVEMGRVRSIHPKPGDQNCPVEVEFELELTKTFRDLPRNAAAVLATDGVLGPTFLEIDLPKVAGPPIADHGTVETLEYTQGLNPEAAAKLKKAVNDVIDKATARPVGKSPAPGSQ